eukprot:m.91164 g.91164  ORF g.91164 m.91164 type:complete len:438 (+) comp15029_c2_seq2:129-1442(+)
MADKPGPKPDSTFEVTSAVIKVALTGAAATAGAVGVAVVGAVTALACGIAWLCGWGSKSESAAERRRREEAEARAAEAQRAREQAETAAAAANARAEELAAEQRRVKEELGQETARTQAAAAAAAEARRGAEAAAADAEAARLALEQEQQAQREAEARAAERRAEAAQQLRTLGLDVDLATRTLIAVCGPARVGKSYLINSLCAAPKDHPLAAAEGVDETTLQAALYLAALIPEGDLLDQPGGGTDRQPVEGYFLRNCLDQMDFIILCYTGGWSETATAVVRGCEEHGVKLVVVRTKFENELRNHAADELGVEEADVSRAHMGPYVAALKQTMQEGLHRHLAAEGLQQHDLIVVHASRFRRGIQWPRDHAVADPAAWSVEQTPRLVRNMLEDNYDGAALLEAIIKNEAWRRAEGVTVEDMDAYLEARWREYRDHYAA